MRKIVAGEKRTVVFGFYYYICLLFLSFSRFPADVCTSSNRSMHIESGPLGGTTIN
jgi:hypothetical protein